jgi:transposase
VQDLAGGGRHFSGWSDASEQEVKAMNTTLMIGIDVAKATFTAATSWQGVVTYAGQFAHTPAGRAEFVAAVGVLAAVTGATALHLIIEPTGGYEAAWQQEAQEQGWLITRVNPGAVRMWGQSRGFRSKTDRKDACLLAQYGAETNPAAQAPVAAEVSELDDLLRRQTDLEQSLRSERNRLGRLKQLPRQTAAVTASLQRTIAALEAELKAIDEAIRALYAAQAGLKAQRTLLLTLPGVGAKIVDYLLVDLHRYHARTQGAGTQKGFAAFLGLDPKLFESGTSVHRRPTISRQGDEVMRTKLYLGALGGVRGTNPLQAFYRSLLGRHKPKKLALVACARKIAVWAWAIFISNIPFDAARFTKMAVGA